MNFCAGIYVKYVQMNTFSYGIRQFGECVVMGPHNRAFTVCSCCFVFSLQNFEVLNPQKNDLFFYFAVTLESPTVAVVSIIHLWYPFVVKFC